jgi:4'-phosphopantetheinyl transferase
VRSLLSCYTAGEHYVHPRDWAFIKGDKGKPELLNSPLPLRFNLSHTQGLICCAVTLSVDVGVDVESVNRRVAHLNVADYKFSESEVAELKSHPQASQKQRFFDYWTLKESYIKAVGGGLSIPLDQFSFHIADDSNISMSFDSRLCDEPELWQNWLIHGSNEHRIALSVKDPQQIKRQVRCFQTIPMQDYWPVTLPLNLT